MLAVPYSMHLLESLLDSGDGEKMVKGATNKERRMRTSQGGDVRIVEVLTECRNAVGKPSVLLSSITQGKLIVGSDHPADIGTRLDLVGEGSKHPGTVCAHRTSHTSYPVLIDHRESRQEIGSSHIVVGHKGRKVAPKHHHVAGDNIILVAVDTFLTATLTPKRCVGREDNIAVTGKIVAKILTFVQLLCPCISVGDNGGVDIKGMYHLLLADVEVGSMVMEGIDGRERSLAVGYKKIGCDAGIGVDTEADFLCTITISLFFGYHLHVPRLGSARWCHHTFKYLLTGSLLPFCKVFDRTVTPCHRVCEFLFELFDVNGQLTLPLVILSHWQLFRIRFLGERWLREYQQGKKCEE